MSPVPNEFEQLRRLLALKRHEQPPPGYFHGFSRQVIVRIRAGELGNESEGSAWSFTTGSLFQRIWAALDARPIFAGAFGVAVCGFFATGALLSDNTTSGSEMANQQPQFAVAQSSVPVWEQPRFESEFSSVTPGLPKYQPPANSLFEEIKNAQYWRQSGAPSPVNVSFP